MLIFGLAMRKCWEPGGNCMANPTVAIRLQITMITIVYVPVVPVLGGGVAGDKGLNTICSDVGRKPRLPRESPPGQQWVKSFFWTLGSLPFHRRTEPSILIPRRRYVRQKVSNRNRFQMYEIPQRTTAKGTCRKVEWGVHQGVG